MKTEKVMDVAGTTPMTIISECVITRRRKKMIAQSGEAFKKLMFEFFNIFRRCYHG